MASGTFSTRTSEVFKLRLTGVIGVSNQNNRSDLVLQKDCLERKICQLLASTESVSEAD